MRGGNNRQRKSRCSVFTLLVHIIFQAAAGVHGSSILDVRSAQAASAAEQSRTAWLVPHGVPHHIYKANVSAVEAWTPCHPDAYPPGAWVSRTGGGHGQASGFGSHLYGTAKVQRFIWAHQHPSDCSTAKYLLYTPIASGIGSILHQMGQALALAIEMQRVLVIAYTPQFPYYSAARCGVGVSFEACYFEPLSSCSWRDATEGITDSIPSINSPSQVTNPALKTVQMSGHFTASDYHCQSVPPQFHSLLRGGPIDWDKKHYWWRAQSVAYIVRPNARTLAELAMRKRRVYPGRQIRRGTISVHVRHGDKHIESTPIPDKVYLAQAEQMARSAAFSWTESLGRAGAHDQAGQPNQNRQYGQFGWRGQIRQPIQIRQQARVQLPPIFLSTEDPSTIEFFARQPLWDVSYANVTRKPDVSKSTLSYVEEIGGYEEMLNSLVNLDLALECDAWIGTLSSNWCRLIDELRATVRCRAHGSFLDAEQKNPPQELNW
ncbi:hypothetical protein COCOBI_04-8080 [Coccomyxa sp. Obi]|nr:hypothetical protein COCOBI_04-8080 [Coccomyxa sp. Obi]